MAVSDLCTTSKPLWLGICCSFASLPIPSRKVESVFYFRGGQGDYGRVLMAFLVRPLPE